MIVKRRIGQICEHPKDHDKIICNEQGFGQGLIRPIGIITPAYLGLPVLLAQAP